MPVIKRSGQCHDCTNPADPGHARCADCRAAAAAAQRLRRRNPDNGAARMDRTPGCPRCYLRTTFDKTPHVCLPDRAVEYTGTHRSVGA